MNNITIAKFLEEVADEIAEEFVFPFQDASLRIEAVAMHLFGLRCQRSESGYFSGEKDSEQLNLERRIIHVDENLSRQQFAHTVAKQVAQYLLHEDLDITNDEFGNNPFFLPKTLLDSERRSLTKEQKEKWRKIETRRFACALLVPRILLIVKAINCEIVDKVAAVSFAQSFDVSPLMILHRIKWLEINRLWNDPRKKEDFSYINTDWGAISKFELDLLNRRRSTIKRNASLDTKPAEFPTAAYGRVVSKVSQPALFDFDKEGQGTVALVLQQA